MMQSKQIIASLLYMMQSLGWPWLALAGLGWPGLAWAGLGWPGLAWAGLGKKFQKVSHDKGTLRTGDPRG
jgi:hypothetical protein